MTAWVVFRLGVSCKLTYRDKHHFTQKSGGLSQIWWLESLSHCSDRSKFFLSPAKTGP